jgi:hypothetical protein
LAGNLVKPLLSLYGTEWRERGYGLSFKNNTFWNRNCDAGFGTAFTVELLSVFKEVRRNLSFFISLKQGSLNI